MSTVLVCCGFKSSFRVAFQPLTRFQLSIHSSALENPTPYGKYRLRYKSVPETLFYVTLYESNFTSPVLTRKGLVCPILGWREAETICRGEVLDTSESLTYKMSDLEHAYMIPKGTPVPDELLLLQDRRWDFNKDYERAYILAPAESCYPHVFEQLFVDFVLRKNCYRLTGTGTLRVSHHRSKNRIFHFA